MRILLFINTPAQAHTWRYVIENLQKRGHQVKILARDYDSTPVLLRSYGLDYTIYIEPKKVRFLRTLQVIPHVLSAYWRSRGFSADIVLGFGVIECFTSVLLRKPCVIFTDSEPLSGQNFFNRAIARVILTPSCFKMDFGKKHIRIPTYKELAYLHPNYFRPDESVLQELGVNRGEKYVILRFNAFDAVHDIGRRGFSLDDKHRLVRELGRDVKVFISSEKRLPPGLEKYVLPICFERIHHCLYYAHLVVCDTGTVATEAAVLGTPAITCFSSVRQFGNFTELEQEYGLIYNFDNPERAIKKALELIRKPYLKQVWAKKRQRLLNDKVDVTQFMVWFIENYPESLRKCEVGRVAHDFTARC